MVLVLSFLSIAISRLHADESARGSVILSESVEVAVVLEFTSSAGCESCVLILAC